MIGFSIAIRVAVALLAQDERLAAAQSVIESDNDPTATECPTAPASRTSRRHHDDYHYATTRTPCFCGLWQTTATSPDLCLLQRAPILGRAAWRAQREAWREICRRRHAGARLEICTIAGYAVGGAGVDAALDQGGGELGAKGLGYALILIRRAAQEDHARVADPSRRLVGL